MKFTKIILLILSVGLLGIYSCNNASQAPAANKDAEMQKENVKKVFAMFETGNTEGIESIVNDNIVEHSPPPGITATGIEGLKQSIKMNHDAFPDSRITVLSMAVDGNIVMCHFNWKGTNTGAMGSIPPTNKVIDVNGVDVVRFENGKGAEHWGYWDEQTYMKQMGISADAPVAQADTTKKM